MSQEEEEAEEESVDPREVQRYESMFFNIVETVTEELAKVFSVIRDKFSNYSQGKDSEEDIKEITFKAFKVSESLLKSLEENKQSFFSLITF